jgi:DNA-binding GntR family transcriptional regulator
MGMGCTKVHGAKGRLADMGADRRVASAATPRAYPALNASPDRTRLNRSLILNDRPERSAHERVLSALRAKDGVLFGSQVALGAAFGWSKTRLHEVLHELEAAGRVRLSISRQGTAVRLVAGTA